MRSDVEPVHFVRVEQRRGHAPRQLACLPAPAAIAWFIVLAAMTPAEGQDPGRRDLLARRVTADATSLEIRTGEGADATPCLSETEARLRELEGEFDLPIPAGQSARGGAGDAWLDAPAFGWDMGVNYLIDGYRAKLTFQYSLRPKFVEQTNAGGVQRVADGSAGQFTIQAQIAL